jgi:uncharacterized damage-inducible protein DinB
MSSTGSVNIGKQVLVTELNYTACANTILLRACEKLTTEELNRDLGGSHSSVIRTLRHIYDGERSWVHNLITSSIPSVADMDAAGAADQSRPDPTLEALQQSWPKVWTDARRWIDSLTEEELVREIPWLLRNGTNLGVPRWKIVLHLVNHASLHRGQIVNMFRALGKQPPPNTDLSSYYQVEVVRT